MSNHQGSYLLNTVLKIFEKNGLFQNCPREDVQKAVLEAATYACEEQDCNSGEILEEIGPRLGVCYACLKAAPQISRGGRCLSCLESM